MSADTCVNTGIPPTLPLTMPNTFYQFVSMPKEGHNVRQMEWLLMSAITATVGSFTNHNVNSNLSQMPLNRNK